MRFTVAYGKSNRIYPENAFAAFVAKSDARDFAAMISAGEPGLNFSVYEDGNLIETFKTDWNEGEK